MSDTVTVYHPDPNMTTPSGGLVTQSLDKADKDLLERHLAQGWLKNPPKGAKADSVAPEVAE